MTDYASIAAISAASASPGWHRARPERRGCVQILGHCIGRLLRSILLYVAILLVVAVCAALIGLMTLQDGHLNYLAHPDTLLWYVWFKRAGLKVQILFVSGMLYFLVAADLLRRREERRR